jgi:hypothetical protein
VQFRLPPQPGSAESDQHAQPVRDVTSAQHAARRADAPRSTDGSIQLGNLPTLIGPTLSRDEARVAFATLMHGERDVGTGYLAQPAPAQPGRCARWHQPVLPRATARHGDDGRRSTRCNTGRRLADPGAIDAEVAFMRRTLATALGRKLAGGHARFDWGEAWARSTRRLHGQQRYPLPPRS